MLPLLVLMGLGTIEVSNMINSYLLLTHMTREGANLVSRGTPADVGGQNCAAPDDALDAIISSAGPVIKCNTPTEWRVIYSKIGPADPTLCAAAPNPGNMGNCRYVVQEQVVRGSGQTDSSKLICPGCGLQDFVCPSTNPSCPAPTNLADIASVAPGLTLYAVEVFYLYQPITPVAAFGVNLQSTLFYDRAIF